MYIAPHTSASTHRTQSHQLSCQGKEVSSEKLKWMNGVLLKTGIQIISVPHASFFSWGLSLAHSIMVNSFCWDFLLHAHAIVGERGSE